ncbi:ABC transporter substrate-binding protein [Actinoplanes sp. NEAU-A12]|uniref:ABC transporter substrate-binding protein n=1 Tax=Actinoplanes sandaracinus TaxID=3045177 RepID=A0ABT6WM42_9ACTN|nr:ABC transporter substrate-binding protein [Actinoplanes sandaracinus]MDI6100800.1 ABC transporter substrate-binding protein [Actinoplanes sandaracinus]
MKQPRTTTAIAAGALALAACGSPQTATGAGSGSGSGPLRVGVVHSQSGPLATYGAQYAEGFRAGLAYATEGTGKVGDRAVEVTYADDAGDPVKAVAAAKDLIGKGFTVLGGSTSSGVALQVAPLAAENRVLFVSGPAATDGLTGVNRYTFRSGRQSYQDVLAAKPYLGDGRKVLVFAPDSAFGRSNVDAVTTRPAARPARRVTARAVREAAVRVGRAVHPGGLLRAGRSDRSRRPPRPAAPRPSPPPHPTRSGSAPRPVRARHRRPERTCFRSIDCRPSVAPGKGPRPRAPEEGPRRGGHRSVRASPW